MEKIKNKDKDILITIIICMVIIAAIYSLSYMASDEYFCKNNPDQCVCESSQVYANGSKPSSNYLIDNNWCDVLRKKTQEELNIDNCNNNPREDDLCRCEEYKHKLQDCRSEEVLGSLEGYPRIMIFLYCSENNLLKERLNECTQARPKTEDEKQEGYSLTYQIEIQGNESVFGDIPTPCREKHFAEGKIIDFGNGYRKHCLKGEMEHPDCYEWDTDYQLSFCEKTKVTEDDYLCFYPCPKDKSKDCFMKMSHPSYQDHCIKNTR